jgi:glutamine amidotransferase
MIVVIDYGAGNIRSVMNMLKSLGAKARIAENGPALDGASRLILPGVGHFDHGMTGLASRGFVDALNEKVLQRAAARKVIAPGLVGSLPTSWPSTRPA